MGCCGSKGVPPAADPRDISVDVRRSRAPKKRGQPPQPATSHQFPGSMPDFRSKVEPSGNPADVKHSYQPSQPYTSNFGPDTCSGCNSNRHPSLCAKCLRCESCCRRANANRPRSVQSALRRGSACTDRGRTASPVRDFSKKGAAQVATEVEGRLRDLMRSPPS